MAKPKKKKEKQIHPLILSMHNTFRAEIKKKEIKVKDEKEWDNLYHMFRIGHITGHNLVKKIIFDQYGKRDFDGDVTDLMCILHKFMIFEIQKIIENNAKPGDEERRNHGKRRQTSKGKVP